MLDKIIYYLNYPIPFEIWWPLLIAASFIVSKLWFTTPKKKG